MARQLKLQQIDILVDHDTGERAKLYFDRNNNTFVGIVGTEEYRDNTANGCKAKTREALKAFKPYAWKPYIFIDEVADRTFYGGNGSGNHVYRVKLSFEFWRNEMAQKQDGHWLERPFLEDWVADSDREPQRRYMGEPYIPTPEDIAEAKAVNKKAREDGSDIKTSGYKDQQSSSDIFRILPYSSEVWLALKTMHTKLGIFRDQLDELTKSKDFETKLFAAAKSLNLLPPKK